MKTKFEEFLGAMLVAMSLAGCVDVVCVYVFGVPAIYSPLLEQHFATSVFTPYVGMLLSMAVCLSPAQCILEAAYGRFAIFYDPDVLQRAHTARKYTRAATLIGICFVLVCVVFSTASITEWPAKPFVLFSWLTALGFGYLQPWPEPMRILRENLPVILRFEDDSPVSYSPEQVVYEVNSRGAVDRVVQNEEEPWSPNPKFRYLTFREGVNSGWQPMQPIKVNMLDVYVSWSVQFSEFTWSPIKSGKIDSDLLANLIEFRSEQITQDVVSFFNSGGDHSSCYIEISQLRTLQLMLDQIREPRYIAEAHALRVQLQRYIYDQSAEVIDKYRHLHPIPGSGNLASLLVKVDHIDPRVDLKIDTQLVERGERSIQDYLYLDGEGLDENIVDMLVCAKEKDLLQHATEQINLYKIRAGLMDPQSSIQSEYAPIRLAN